MYILQSDRHFQFAYLSQTNLTHMYTLHAPPLRRQRCGSPIARPQRGSSTHWCICRRPPRMLHPWEYAYLRCTSMFRGSARVYYKVFLMVHLKNMENSVDCLGEKEGLRAC